MRWRRHDTIEIWFADEARIGQKNKLTRRWARRGTRPRAPHDQRTASTYIFGAICPDEGKGAALVLPFCDTEAMHPHLAEISAMVAPGHTPFCSSIRPDGIFAGARRAQTSRLCRFRRDVQSSIPSKTSGSSCATTGCRTASSNPTTISSTTAVPHGISSSISHGASCPSDCAIGHKGSDQWDLV